MSSVLSHNFQTFLTHHFHGQALTKAQVDTIRLTYYSGARDAVARAFSTWGDGRLATTQALRDELTSEITATLTQPPAEPPP